MDRLSEDESKIVVKVGDSHLLKTKFGYALILNAEYVVFIKDWQVDRNNYGNEVLLTKEYFIPQKWGDFSDEFEDDEENLSDNVNLPCCIAFACRMREKGNKRTGDG